MRRDLLLKLTTPIARGFLFLLLFNFFGCKEKQPTKDTFVLPTVPAKIPFDRPNVRNYFDSLFEAGRFNGTVIVAKNDSLTKFALGERRLGSEDQLKTNDAFQLASLSKPITALGVLRLVELGKIHLDDPVKAHLFDFPEERITIRSLLNHTSGMGNYIYVTDSLWNRPDSFMRYEDVYDIVRCEQVPKYHPPLRRFDYCNTNYAVLPMLIERVSGLTFSTFMQQEVFRPLGMDSTRYLDPWDQTPDQYPVIGHYPNGDPKRPFYLDGVVGDKSLYSSVDDLYRLYEEMRSPTLWSPELIDEAMAPSVRSGRGQFYGLGWRIRPLESDTIVFHNGWWRGFRTYFWMSKKEDKVAIILTNSIRGGYLGQEHIWSLF